MTREREKRGRLIGRWHRRSTARGRENRAAFGGALGFGLRAAGSDAAVAGAHEIAAFDQQADFVREHVTLFLGEAETPGEFKLVGGLVGSIAQVGEETFAEIHVISPSRGARAAALGLA